MNQEQRAALRKVAEEATPGPWMRQQLAEKDGEIERLKEELTTAAIDIKKAIDESRKVLVANWTEKFSLQQQQLAASQAREVQLREALAQVMDDIRSEDYLFAGGNGVSAASEELANVALALTQDASALESMIAKAGEVMRERCERVPDSVPIRVGNNGIWGVEVFKEIRALPGVTLEDVNGI